MFCVIQEVATKTVPAGEPKGIEVYESRWTADGKEFCSYEYRNSAERFERPIRKSYRISIHESYRENGKVKKNFSFQQDRRNPHKGRFKGMEDAD